jgi:aerotaxis receptor
MLVAEPPPRTKATMQSITPIDRESHFGIEELFFSTTDRRGVIEDGNDVFVRVSKHPRETLRGSPHNIIRHPDMPRAVFWLLWNYVLSGKSIVAYVKNMAADGAYYWVLALVTPIKEGMLSIRMKPSSELLKTVQGVYKQMRQIEATIESRGEGKQAAIEASRAHLESAIRSLGLRDYDDLMQRILLAESRSRRSSVAQQNSCNAAGASHALEQFIHHSGVLRTQVDGLFERVGGFLDLEKALTERITYIRQLGGSLQLMALNAQIRAAGLEQTGRTLQVVAQQMSDSAQSISTATDQICRYMTEVGAVLRSAGFQIASSDLSVEMMSYFLAELSRSGAEHDDATVHHRLTQLAEVVQKNLDATCTLIDSTSEHMIRLQQQIDDFVKQIRTLEILRVTGKVEAVNSAFGERVAVIFEDVYTTTKTARERLGKLVELISQAKIESLDRNLINGSLACLTAA